MNTIWHAPALSYVLIASKYNIICTVHTRTLAEFRWSNYFCIVTIWLCNTTISQRMVRWLLLCRRDGNQLISILPFLDRNMEYALFMKEWLASFRVVLQFTTFVLLLVLALSLSSNHVILYRMSDWPELLRLWSGTVVECRPLHLRSTMNSPAWIRDRVVRDNSTQIMPYIDFTKYVRPRCFFISLTSVTISRFVWKDTENMVFSDCIILLLIILFIMTWLLLLLCSNSKIYWKKYVLKQTEKQKIDFSSEQMISHLSLFVWQYSGALDFGGVVEATDLYNN